MTDTIPGYPLQWPAGWKRTGRAFRTRAAFSSHGRRLSIADGRERVLLALDRMGIATDDVVVSSMVPLRLDGMPRSNVSEPFDSGAAVYWIDGRERRCMAVDRYERVADNLAAIAATLDAMRAIERHGGAEILNRAFTGFAALPGVQRAPWWQVLGLAGGPMTIHDAREAYRRLAAEHHPDRGGDAGRMAEVNAAWAAAQQELIT